jgi:hypothetical protein
MDRERCLAVAVAKFGGLSEDSLFLSAEGHVRVERQWQQEKEAEAGSVVLLRSFYHFVPFPPQRSAATQPQAMLAPLGVTLEAASV